jgi:tRNA A-37 threonylcarbamoyl transferase component Bud32
MERKLLPKLLTEDFNVADKIACNFIVAVASTNERALKQHLHFFFQYYRIGTEDQRDFAQTVLHSIKDKEMAKNINQILSTIHITSLIDARKDITSIDTSSSDSHTSSHSSTHSNGSDFTIGGTPKNIKLKLSYMNETHAMVITQETTWKSLLERIQHISHERDVGIEYKDEDDDFITMNSDHDFEEFKQYLRVNAISSIKVKVKLTTSFKDTTATQTHTPTAMHVGTPVFPHTPTNNVYTPTSAPTVFSSDSFLSEQASDGSTIQWRKGGLIGAGASGKVFLGLDLNSGSMIAVKKIRLPDFHDSMLEREIKQIETEILLMKSLKHCNVVNYLGYSRDGNKLYLFLEYMSGGSLSSLIAKFGGCLPEVVIQKYLTQILNGLSYLHLNGVVHRDIKGANLLMDHGDIKLSDFGLSKLINRDVGNSFSTKGTPAYMSPEIITRQEYSYGSDMWALGCTILEMFTGVPPWSELELKDPIQLMLRIATTNTAPAIPKSRMSENLYNLVMRCFEIKPQDRATAMELLDHPFLQEFVPVSPDRNLNMEKQSTVVSPESFTEYLSYESDTYGESSLTSSGSDF